MTWAAPALAFALTLHAQDACTPRDVALRGTPQHVRLCGDPHGTPAIVASGDGGWIRLAPHVAAVLAARGYFVLGFDSRAYLESFTGGPHPLDVNDVAADFRSLIDALSPDRRKVLLAGVSEGAALAVAAAASDDVKPRVAGVVTMGLGEVNELAWRWRDAVIYLTKGIPNEPAFRSSSFIARVAPAPIALIQSTNDEYVTRAEAARLTELAQEPKRAWAIDASDHAFSDNRAELDRRLADATTWIAAAATWRSTSATWSIVPRASWHAP
jgi:alpha-beta hydrolase superfamily lysophospholipase